MDDRRLLMIEDLNSVLKSRSQELERAVDQIAEHNARIVKLRKRANAWSRSVDELQALIDELWEQIDEPDEVEEPIDMTPTGEGDDDDDDPSWADAGFTVQ